ncbi:MAG TPA: PqqD family protein [Acidimicrobiia bacterium]|nr:PqqD family protein [Acidimicrobiia bacterium]
MGFKYVRRGNRVAFRAYGDKSGGVLLDLDTSLYFGVNSVGALVWELIGSGNEIARIVDEMHSKIDDPPEDLADDVDQFLAELEERRLVILDDVPR